VDGSLQLGGIFVAVAGEAQAGGRCGDQLYPGNVSVDPNFVTHITSQRYRRMNCFPLHFVFMTAGTLGGICIFVQGNRVNVGAGQSATKQREAGHRR
jgi:hypothetical protein